MAQKHSLNKQQTLNLNPISDLNDFKDKLSHAYTMRANKGKIHKLEHIKEIDGASSCSEASFSDSVTHSSFDIESEVEPNTNTND